MGAKRYKTKLFASKEDSYCSCDRVAGENCRCGSSRYIDYGIWDNQLKRFTRHQKVGYAWRWHLVALVKKLNG